MKPTSHPINIITDAPGGNGIGWGRKKKSPKSSHIINEIGRNCRRGTVLSHSRISWAHASRSSITPIDQLLCQASPFLMSCEKTQWNKSRYRANKLLIAVWDFYLLACSCTWQGLKGVERGEEVKPWIFNYLIFMSSSVGCGHGWTGWIIPHPQYIWGELSLRFFVLGILYCFRWERTFQVSLFFSFSWFQWCRKSWVFSFTWVKVGTPLFENTPSPVWNIGNKQLILQDEG